MTGPPVTTVPLQDFPLWKRVLNTRRPMSFELELTARCNLRCRHCYIQLSENDEQAGQEELTGEEIREICREAVSMGTLWCLITGGEPLLRKDFPEIYLDLKKMGLLITLFTNATLLSKEHAILLRDFPPRDIEISVYGTDAATYERITRKPGSYDAFLRGLALLDEHHVPFRLKAMIMRSNIHQFRGIKAFCAKRTKDFFRFDPFLHLRVDLNASKNSAIIEERLTPEEIVALEASDPERVLALRKECTALPSLDSTPSAEPDSAPLFLCKAGQRSFTIGHNALFRLCNALHHPSCVYDLRTGTLGDAWDRFAVSVFSRCSSRPSYLSSCASCPLYNLCMWCPALAHLETGELDAPVEAFCAMAETRYRASGDSYGSPDPDLAGSRG